MDYYPKRECNMEIRVCNQALLPGGMLTICLDYSYDNLSQTQTTYNPRCALHWWAGVEPQESVLFCPT